MFCLGTRQGRIGFAIDCKVFQGIRPHFKKSSDRLAGLLIMPDDEKLGGLPGGFTEWRALNLLDHLTILFRHPARLSCRRQWRCSRWYYIPLGSQSGQVASRSYMRYRARQP